MEDLLSTWTDSYDKLYLKAINELNMDLLKYLIQGNYPIKSIDKCFVAIIQGGNLEALHIFVTAGYIPNSSLGKYFLKTARFASKLSLIKYLYESQIHIDYIIRYDPENFYVINNNVVDVFDYLLENNMIDQLSIDAINEMALVYAYVPLYKMVLKYNPDVNLDLWLEEAIHSSWDSISFLISMGANPNYNNSELIKGAYMKNDEELLKLLLDKGGDVSNVSLTDLPIVKLLYDRGVRY